MSSISTAVLLAAGLGSRLKDRTREMPKAFLEVDGRTLIERSIDNLIESGITRIIIGTGYLPDYFEALKENFPMIETHRNEDFASTGSMFTLYNLRHLINEPFLLLEADLLYERRALSVLMNDKAQDIILASGATHSKDEVFIESGESGELVNMSKNRNELAQVSGELVGISKISESTFNTMCSYAARQYEQGNLHIDYEDDFVGISSKIHVNILKIEDLAWCEIDDEHHLKRALDQVYPLIRERDTV